MAEVGGQAGGGIRVSVIIPCFNRERLVGEAIESALRQGPGVEVIVVDDGSTDGSWDVLQSFGQRVRSYRTANGGVSNARNFGVRQARAPFIRFLDSDDRIPEDAVQEHFAAAAALPAHQIAFGDARSIDEKGAVIHGVAYGYSSVAPPGPLPRAALLSHTMSPYLPMFPALALRACGGFAPALSLSEDVELAVRLSLHGYQFVRVPIIVAEVREHQGARLSRNYGAEGYRKLLALYRHILSSFAKSAAPLADDEAAAFARMIWTIARSASREAHRTEASELFHLASQLAGRDAWNGPVPLRALYSILPAYSAERLLMAVKASLRRKT